MNKFDIGQTVYCKETLSFVLIIGKELHLSNEPETRVSYSLKDLNGLEIENVFESELVSLNDFIKDVNTIVDDIKSTPLNSWED